MSVEKEKNTNEHSKLKDERVMRLLYLKYCILFSPSSGILQFCVLHELGIPVMLQLVF